MQQVIDVAGQITGRPIPVEMGPRRAGDPAVLIASSDCIRQELGWRPTRQDLGVIVEIFSRDPAPEQQPAAT